MDTISSKLSIRVCTIMVVALLCVPAEIPLRVLAQDAHGSSIDDVSETLLSQQQKLVAMDGSASDAFGYSVAISGKTAVIGSPLSDVNGILDQGAAYVQVFENGIWLPQAKLFANDGKAEDQLGYSVAIDGDTIVVSARRPEANYTGAAYVFVRSGVTWTQQARLIGESSISEDDDGFGRSVAISGNTIVVGVPLYNPPGTPPTNKGAAFVFTRTGTVWAQQAKLISTTSDPRDFLGDAVAIDGDTIICGAPDSSNIGSFNPGSATVFTRSGNTWSEQAKLQANDGHHNDFFGGSVSLNGDTAVVGALGVDIAGNSNQGAAYVFTRSGNAWLQQAKLTANDGAEKHNFGDSVFLKSGSILVGSYVQKIGANDSQGAAYLFTGSGTDWSQQAKFAASDGSANDMLSFSVAMDGNLILAGMPQRFVSFGFPNSVDTQKHGAAYSFVAPGDTPQILDVTVKGKKLIVTGTGFQSPAEIYLNGDKQKKTSNDEQDPATTIIARKAGKLIAPGQTAVIQVKNSASGKLSNEFLFTRPL